MPECLCCASELPLPTVADCSVACRTSSNGVQELIVVTILLAAKGNLRVPAITSAPELKDALNKLGAVRSDQVITD